MGTNGGAEQKKKKGFFAWLSNMARGGNRPAGISSGASRSVSSATGAARQAVSMPSVARITAGSAKSASGFLPKLVSALRLPSFLATRAGVMGLILGGVTLATGLAAMTGFMNEPAKSAYNPGLFNNSYYDSLVAQAEKDRLSRGSESGAEGGSSLDMLQRQFEGEQSANEEALASEEKASPVSASPVSAKAKKAASPAMPSMPKASAAAGRGFGSSGFTFGGGGGSSSSASQKSSAGGGGLRGGGGGGGAATSGSLRGGTAPRGAYRQAQAGKRSLGSAGTVSGKQAAASMFYDGGGTVGGEVSAVNAGAGMGGAPGGAAEGSNEAATDSVTAPEVPQAEAGGGGGGGGGDSGTEAPLTEDKGAPWKNLAVLGVVAGIGAAIGIVIIGLLGKFGRSGPHAAIVLAIQLALLGIVLGLAAIIISAGVRMLKEFNQQKEGLTLIAAGAALAALAIGAMFIGKFPAAGAAGALTASFGTIFPAAIGGLLGIGGATAGALGATDGGISALTGMVDGTGVDPDTGVDYEDAGKTSSSDIIGG